MNNLSIEPIDPLVKDDNNPFFYADEKMLNILKNDDIQEYFDYIKNKNKIKKEKLQFKIKEEKLIKLREELENEREENRNRNKKLMLSSIADSISILEDTIKKFKFN
jgi:hypothetical protein